MYDFLAALAHWLKTNSIIPCFQFTASLLVFMNIDTIPHFVQSIAGTTQIHFFNVKEHGTFEVVPDTPLSILMG